MASDQTIFALSAADVETLRATVRRKPEVGPNPDAFGSRRTSDKVWLKITGSTSVGVNKWKYTGATIQKIGPGHEWATGATVTDIYNRMESFNTGSLAAGYALVAEPTAENPYTGIEPIHVGAVVECERRWDDEGEKWEMWFAEKNDPIVECAEEDE